LGCPSETPTLDGLYAFCTILGTVHFALIFLNYYVEADRSPQEPTSPAPAKSSEKKQMNRSASRD
jgi:hypothetical protein